MRILFSGFSGDTSEETLNEARKIYSNSYEKTRRAVPGAKQLLRVLKEKVKIGIVSNNFIKGQIGKLNATGLAPFIDIMVTSEEIGVTKPEREIFEAALKKLECSADEAVMIGDSWEIDIAGACNAGIRAVWFNRFGSSCPDNSLAKEIKTFKPIEEVLKIILI
jgi:putative hydrolase of the HAD superfamily